MSKRKTTTERLEAAKAELTSRVGALAVEFTVMKERAEKAEARCEELERRETSHRQTCNALDDRQRETANELDRVRKHRNAAVKTLKALAETLNAAVEQMDCDPDDLPF